MKIISDFKDYYDTACKYGIDPNIKYVRKSVEEWVDISRNGSLSYSNEVAEKLRPAMEILLDIPNSVDLVGIGHSGYIHISKVVIGFCGKLYPALSLNKKNFFYDQNSFIRGIQECILKYSENKEKAMESFNLSLSQKVDPKRPWKNDVFSRQRWENIEKQCNTTFHKLFAEVGCPVFSIVKEDWRPACTITLNDRLSNYNFYTAIEPNDAFQSISVYLGNELATQIDPTDTISDNVKIHKHGFDKNSFRKQSTKKG